MKKLLLSLSLCFTAVLAAQEVTLKPYDAAAYTVVNSEGNEKGIIKNPVYTYLIDNYNAISDKEILPPNGGGDCGFTQTFENGIVYTKRNCGDASLATGEVLTISNPNRESVLLWVESVNKIFGDYGQNHWNFDLTEYRPTNNLLGGFFTIKRDTDYTTVLVMSGC
jgi:hypothetical protein